MDRNNSCTNQSHYLMTCRQTSNPNRRLVDVGVPFPHDFSTYESRYLLIIYIAYLAGHSNRADPY
nr:hypothetical protein Q903MT_gene5372 [Picea sitchensis]